MNSRVLGIDIGLKNLSLCIMSRPFQIHYWELVDVITPRCIQCPSKSTHRFKGIYSCETHQPPPMKSKPFIVKVKNVPNPVICQRIVSWFNDLDRDTVFKDVSLVLIEDQGRSTGKIKFTSHVLLTLLTSYFHGTNTLTRYVHANEKLREFEGPDFQLKTKKDEYAKRKELAILRTRWYLENKFTDEEKNKWIGKLKSADCADSFLYCVYGIHRPS
jgi:hypothetical protein